eukprot:5082807-Amphidinium_carterae.1
MAQTTEAESADVKKSKLLYALARDHIVRHLNPLPDEQQQISPHHVDGSIASVSCARAKRTILQTPLPPAKTRGQTFAETSFLPFGAVTSRGLAHAHANDVKHGALLAAIHHLASYRRDAHPYLAAGLISGQSPWHQDLSVVGKSSTVSLGNYSGGLLEILSASQRDSKLIDTCNRWHTFLAWSPHRVTDYEGSRVAIVLYTPQNVHTLPRKTWLELHRAGFPVLQFLIDELNRLSNESVQDKNFAVYQEVQQMLVDECIAVYPVLELDQAGLPTTGLPTIDENMPTVEHMDDDVNTVGDGLNEHLDILPSADLLDLAKDDQMRHHLDRREEQKKLPKTVQVQEPTKEQKSALLKAHINLGHPRQQEFLRALRLAGVTLSLRLWVRDFFKCPACQSMRIGGLRRPATLPRTFSFNMSIAMDSFEIAPERLPPMHFVLIVDIGTRYITAHFAGTSVSTDHSKAALATWVAHFGVPHAVQTDDGPEFRGPFSEAVEHMGAMHIKTDAYAPHQNGMAERQVGLVKHHFELALEMGATVGSEPDLCMLMSEIVAARNAFIDRSGHSSAQRVLGTNPRRPLLGVLQEDHLDFNASALEEQDPKQEHARARSLRQHALGALMQQDAHTRVARAMKARNRVQETLRVGDWVYILRSNRLGRKWREGPAIITMLAGATTWVSLRGHLYKVASINVRKATEDEINSVKGINPVMADLQSAALEQRGRRRFTDVSRESAWDSTTGPEEQSTALPSRETSRRPSTSASSETASTPLPSSATPIPIAQPTSIPVVSSSPAAPRIPSTPRPQHTEAAQDSTDMASHAHAEAVSLRAGRRGRSPSAPRRVRPRGSDSVVQAEVNRIETAIAQQASAGDQTDAGMSGMDVDAHFVYTWSEQEDLWTQHTWEAYFADPDNDVPFRHLDEEELKGFAQAMEKEAKSMMVDNQALVPLGLEESENIRNNKPDLILPSRWHFKRKVIETPDGITKTPRARWILLGHKDNAAVQLGETSYAPTPSLLTINIVLQALASGKREVATADFSAAFLQANDTEREVYISQPPEGVPGLPVGALLRMKVEIYGSTAGPASWRNTLVPSRSTACPSSP